MPYPPNENVTNAAVFNGGTAGTTVSPGKYALDWIVALGGSVNVTNNGTTLDVIMPFLPDGTPTPIPQELAALIVNVRLSLIAAVAGKVYPPGSDQPRPPVAPYYP